MAEKTGSFEVLIDGKVYRLTGADPAYLQKIASYINQKIKECKAAEGYRGFDGDYRDLLLNFNISDDYFREKEENQRLNARIAELEKELYSARHDAVSMRMKLEGLQKRQEGVSKEETEQKNREGQRPRKDGN